MLGRSVGLSTEQLSHLGDEPLLEGVYDESEAAIVRYAQVSARSIAIDGDVYGALAKHFSAKQIMEICVMFGMSNLVNRLHATFLSDVDEATLAAVEAGDAVSGACTLPWARDAARFADAG